MKSLKTLAERLAWARKRKRYSQQQLASLAGISQAAIGNIESGIRFAGLKTAVIASLLDVPALWLAEGKGTPPAELAGEPPLDTGSRSSTHASRGTRTIHETMGRLYLAAKTLRGIEGPAELARLLNESPQVVNNWERRGVSSAGLLNAVDILDIRPIWIAKGEEPMMESGAQAPDVETSALRRARRERLAQLRDTFCDGSIALLAARLDKQPSYVSRMLYDEDKAGVRSIGEGMARHIERKFGLAQYALDSLEGDLAVVDEGRANNLWIASALDPITEEQLAYAIEILQKILVAKRLAKHSQSQSES
ncbi:helix-turn-helix domain-containing protein [Paraburkholderia youngii]|uniref:helix-turn-helix domain-containing protein n=1 Tax=Paraburkholderia youngii TaxID=2782701 RepID=UPI003D211178